jgi:hypothetical protein
VSLNSPVVQYTTLVAFQAANALLDGLEHKWVGTAQFSVSAPVSSPDCSSVGASDTEKAGRTRLSGHKQPMARSPGVLHGGGGRRLAGMPILFRPSQLGEAV